MTVTDKIKAIRDELRLSQAEIARRLEIEPPSYHRLENRGDKLSVEQLQSIAQALGVTMLEILSWGELEQQTQNSVEMEKENEILRKRVRELEEDIARSHRITDGFLYMLNGGKGMSEEIAKEIAESFEADLGKAVKASGNRLGMNLEDD